MTQHYLEGRETIRLSGGVEAMEVEWKGTVGQGTEHEMRDEWNNKKINSFN